MRSIIIVIVTVLFLFIAGTQLFLPPLLEARIGAGLEQAVGDVPVEVHVFSFPAYKMLGGHIGRLSVTLGTFDADGLEVESLELEARDLQFDVGALIRGDVLEMADDERLNARAFVTERALTEYARHNVDLPGTIFIEVDDGGVHVAGGVVLPGAALDVAVTGRFRGSGTTEIEFSPDEVSVEGQQLPALLIGVVKQMFHFVWDVGDGPLPFIVEEVEHETGRIVINGRAGFAGPQG